MPSAGEDRLCQQRDSGEEARGMERRVADYLPYRSSWLAMLDEGEEECSKGKNDETRSHKGEIESLDAWVIEVVDSCD